MSTPNSTYNQLLSVSVANYSEQELEDNITGNNALLIFLKKKGNYKPADGGVEITENILFAEASAGGWYDGSEVLSTSDSDVLTTANFAWKQHYALITMNGKEIVQNAGKSRMSSLIEGKLAAATAKMQNGVGAALFYANTESGGKAIGGLQHTVADDPTTGTVGGIDSSVATNSWWRNYVFSFGTASLTPSSSTILTALNTSFLNTNRGTEKVDLVLAGTTYFGYFEGALQAQQRIMDAELGKAGFEAYRYKSAMVMHDPNCSATRMYGLNTSTVLFRPTPSRNFTQGERRESVNQDVFAIPMWFMGNMTVRSRRRNFVIKS
jgi:hypothetical protein